MADGVLLLSHLRADSSPSPRRSLLVLQHVGAERGVNLLPAAQVCSGFVEQVAVTRREEVLHQDHRRADGNQEEELTRPAFVVVLSVLGGG